MRRSRLITVWSVLALLTAAMGTAGTLVMARAWVRSWVDSGIKLPVGSAAQVRVPADRLQSLVFYESDETVPGNVRLDIRDRFGERYRVRVPADDQGFEVDGRHGRALFHLDLPEPGVYDVRCLNPNYASDDEVPVDDAIVFLKDPDSKDGMLAGRRVLVAVGASVTVAVTLLLYVLHGVTLLRRRRSIPEPGGVTP